MITRRGWGAVLGALLGLLLAAAALNPAILAIALGLLGFLAVEIVRFHIRYGALDERSVSVERLPLPARLPANSELVTGIDLRYNGAVPAWIALSDVVPEAFPVTVGPARTIGEVAPGGVLRLRYAFRPTLRGAYVLGPVGVAILDPLGLSRIVLRPPASRRPSTVVPAAIVAPHVRPGLALFSRAALGIDLRRRGYGTEFRSLRPYQPFDDVRHMAWKRSRPPTYFVREFEQEARQSVLVVLDLTPSMGAGVWGESALDRSVEAAALLAALVARQGEDKIGLATYSDGIFQFLEPRRASDLTLVKLGDNLAMIAPRPGQFRLSQLLEELRDRLKTPTHVYLFSTLTGPMTGLHSAYVQFRRKGHRLRTFVPRLGGFYPEPEEATGLAALDWARSQERRRLEWTLHITRGEGIVTVPFDRRGANGSVLRSYGEQRSGGIA